MKCSNCEQVLDEGSDFCGKCGSSIGIELDSSDISSTKTNFSDAVRLGFKRYFDFRGRASRAEIWWWVLFTFLAGSVLAVVDTLTGTMGMFGDSGLLGQLFEIAVLVPSLALGARRLHDINRNGWWLLLWLAPVIGWIILVVWAIRRGDEGTNKYGLNLSQSASK